MDKKDILEIAEGLRLIEEGVEKIQGVMREKNMKSIKEIAAQLMPVLREDDDSLTESVIQHLD